MRTEPAALDGALHRALQKLNEQRLRPTLNESHATVLEAELEERRTEEAFLDSCRAAEAEQARTAPTAADEFVAWFEALRDTGPGQHDPLFPWLEHEATLADLRWFVRQEVAGEAGFDDLVALTQLGMPHVPKLELARNYWDEMGRGHESAMHGPMLARLARALDIDRESEPVCESLALANLLVGLAYNRSYAFHAVGALGVVELTAPDRARCVSRGLKRLHVDNRARQYYALHATLDVEHSRAWNRDVIAPLVREDPRRAAAIAEGALMRLRAGERCFVRYRHELGVAA